MKFFSIIIPIYEMPLYLQQCISSLTCQILKDIEIIVVSVQEIKKVTKVIELYSELDNRIKHISVDKSNFVDGLNTALEMASGEYITLLNPDDFLMTDALYNILKVINHTDADIILSSEYIYSETGNLDIEERAINGIELDKVIELSKNLWIVHEIVNPRSFFIKKYVIEENKISYTNTKFKANFYLSIVIKSIISSKKMYIMKIPTRYCRNQKNKNLNFEDAELVRNEYNDIINFALNKRSLFIPHLQKVRYMICSKNYDSINNKCKKKYLAELSSDFKSDIQLKLVSPDKYNRKEKIKFMLISYLPWLFDLIRRKKII